jgi:hypothetical protein
MSRRGLFPAHGWRIEMETRVRIIDIHQEDAWYSERKRLLGRVGTFEPNRENLPGYFSGRFVAEGEDYYFFAVKVEKIRRKVERR